MDYLLQGLASVSVHFYDILIFSKHWEQHLTQFQEVLFELQGDQLTIKLAKTICN